MYKSSKLLIENHEFLIGNFFSTDRKNGADKGEEIKFSLDHENVKPLLLHLLAQSLFRFCKVGFLQNFTVQSAKFANIFGHYFLTFPSKIRSNESSPCSNGF